MKSEILSKLQSWWKNWGDDYDIREYMYVINTYLYSFTIIKKFWKQAKYASKKNLAKQQVFPLLSAALIPVFILIIWINLVIELLNCNIIGTITSRSPHQSY